MVRNWGSRSQCRRGNFPHKVAMGNKSLFRSDSEAVGHSCWKAKIILSRPLRAWVHCSWCSLSPEQVLTGNKHPSTHTLGNKNGFLKAILLFTSRRSCAPSSHLSGQSCGSSHRWGKSTVTRLWCSLTGHPCLKPHYLPWAQRDHMSPSFLEPRKTL